jgi:ABC-type sugar transport system, permease component
MVKRKLLLWVLMILAFIMCYPILFLTIGAIMSQGELKESLRAILLSGEGFASWRAIPLYPTLRHYIEILLDSPEFFLMFWNSVKMSVFILSGQLLVGVPAAWGFARFNFPFKKALFSLYIVLMMMPFQVTMLSNYLVLNKLKLIDTHAAIILPAIFSTFPIFIMYRFFCGVPESLIESAKIDGANAVQIFMKLGLPLGSAGIISAMVLGFLEYWNLIEQPLAFLRSKSLWPLSLYLPNITLERAGMSFAASVIALIPAILVFLGGQDYLEQGIIATAIKE